MDQWHQATSGIQMEALSDANRTTRTPLVCSALNSKTVEVTGWHYEQLHAGVGEWTAVHRFTGQGRDRGQAVPWSLIQKTLRPQGSGDDPSTWNYHRREADAYPSGWLADLPGGVAAPRCYGVSDQPDGTCWMWLEDIVDEIGPHWSLVHYGVVARHLGQLNGAYSWTGPCRPTRGSAHDGSGTTSPRPLLRFL